MSESLCVEQSLVLMMIGCMALDGAKKGLGGPMKGGMGLVFWLGYLWCDLWFNCGERISMFLRIHDRNLAAMAMAITSKRDKFTSAIRSTA